MKIPKDTKKLLEQMEEVVAQTPPENPSETAQKMWREEKMFATMETVKPLHAALCQLLPAPPLDYDCGLEVGGLAWMHEWLRQFQGQDALQDWAPILSSLKYGVNVARLVASASGSAPDAVELGFWLNQVRPCQDAYRMLEELSQNIFTRS